MSTPRGSIEIEEIVVIIIFGISCRKFPYLWALCGTGIDSEEIPGPYWLDLWRLQSPNQWDRRFLHREHLIETREQSHLKRIFQIIDNDFEFVSTALDIFSVRQSPISPDYNCIILEYSFYSSLMVYIETRVLKLFPWVFYLGEPNTHLGGEDSSNTPCLFCRIGRK